MASDKQIIIKSKILQNDDNYSYKSKNINNNNEKYSIFDFKVDQPVYNTYAGYKSAESIKIRQDIASDLYAIKNHLNIFGVPLSCHIVIPNLNYSNISDFARVGLEVKLFSEISLQKNSSYENDDYFIGPQNLNYTKRLNVYGLTRKDSDMEEVKYFPKKDIYNIYEIKHTYGTNKPRIKRIYKSLLNITKIFYDYGFSQPEPEEDFFEKSIPEKSNWNIFIKNINLKIGTPYKQLLETVYERNNNKIWLEPDKYWDGEKFSG